MRASCFKGSGRWLQGPGGAHFYGRLAFRSSHEYRAALRMRLLLSPASSDVGDASGVVLCSCGQQFDPADQPFHVLDCSDSQWHFIQRHNLVRNLLCEFIQKKVIHRVELEPSVGRRNGTEITTEDNIAEADARQVERRRASRLHARQRPVTQSVSAFAADRARQLREGHFRADIGILAPTKNVSALMLLSKILLRHPTSPLLQVTVPRQHITQTPSVAITPSNIARKRSINVIGFYSALPRMTLPPSSLLQ